MWLNTCSWSSLWYEFLLINHQVNWVWVNQLTLPFWGQLCTFTLVLSLLGRHFHYCKENYYVYCLIYTCTFRLAKHWRICICYRQVLYYFNKYIYYCPWHLRKTQFQCFFYCIYKSYQQGSKLLQSKKKSNIGNGMMEKVGVVTDID